MLDALPSPLPERTDPSSPDDPKHQTGSPMSSKSVRDIDPCIDRWEDEGGSMVHKDQNLYHSPVQKHITQASDYMMSGHVDNAVVELQYAANRLATYHADLRASMDATIGQLSTQGCRATGPHPKALDLIRLRQKLPT